MSDAQEQPRKRDLTWAKRGGIGLSVIAMLLGAGYWWQTGRFLESTDDAYVRADWVAVSARVPAYVAEVRVNDNQVVKAGDLLLRLDDRDYRQQLNAAEAHRDRLSAAVQAQKARLAAFDGRLAEQRATQAQADAELLAARAETRRAELDWKRYRELAAQQVASAQRLENADASRSAAQAALKRAEASQKREQARSTVLVEQRREAESEGKRVEAELREAQAATEVARNALEDTQIRAPFDGVVGQRKVRVSQYVTPGQALLAVVPVEQAYVVANFKETQLRGMRPGQPVTLDVDTFGQRWHGTLDSLAPGSGAVFALLPPDNATGNFTKIVQRFPVRIRLEPATDGAPKLLPGMSVTATVDTHGEDSHGG